MKKLKRDEKVTMQLTLTVAQMRKLRDYLGNICDESIDSEGMHCLIDDNPVHVTFEKWLSMCDEMEENRVLIPILEKAVRATRTSLGLSPERPSFTGFFNDSKMEKMLKDQQERRIKMFPAFRKWKLNGILNTVCHLESENSPVPASVGRALEELGAKLVLFTKDTKPGTSENVYSIVDIQTEKPLTAPIEMYCVTGESDSDC